MPSPKMDPGRRTILAAYVQMVAGILHLDWQFSIGSCSRSHTGRRLARLNIGSRRGRLEVSDLFWKDSAEEMRNTIVHELLHAAFLTRPVNCVSCVSDIEAGISKLADAVASCFPLMQSNSGF